MNYTVFFEQINGTNFQVKAKDEDEAEAKAIKLYKRRMDVPASYVQEGWLVEADGEDK